mmetsp:Transcript_24096/g.69260  ORF Transcript_24096/g.69260 Transcript_24096/m.69260 type:complete len:395 (-) Transcript_24096:1147-2331(-)
MNRLQEQRFSLVLHYVGEGLEPKGGIGAIDLTVIARQCNSHLLSLLQSEHRLSIGLDDLSGGSNGKDAALSRGEDGVELVDSEHTHVGDSEGSRGVFIGRKRVGSGLADKLLPVLGKLSNRSLVGVLESGGDETTIDGNGHGNVDIRDENSTLLSELTVDDGVLLNRKGDGLGKKSRYRDALVLYTSVQCVELVHADVPRGTEDRSSESGNHVIGDSTLHTGEGNKSRGHLHRLGTTGGNLTLGLGLSSGGLDIVEGNTAELTSASDGGKIQLGLLGSGAGHWSSRNDTRGRSPRGLGGGSLLGRAGTAGLGILNVRGSDASIGASTDDCGEVKTKLLGTLLGKRRGNDTVTSRLGSSRSSGGSSLRGRRSGSSSGGGSGDRSRSTGEGGSIGL